MTDEESEEYDNWTSKLREVAYGSSAAVTVGMIIADVFGCAGFCSGIVTTGAWVGSLATVEKGIADYRAELEGLESQASDALENLEKLDQAAEAGVKILSTELELIQVWSQAMEKVSKKVEQFSQEEKKAYASYKDQLSTAVTELSQSAENFLKFSTSNEGDLELDLD